MFSEESNKLETYTYVRMKLIILKKNINLLSIGAGFIYIKVKWKKDMFGGLLIFQCFLTSRFCLNTKIFYQNYFCIRNN